MRGTLAIVAALVATVSHAQDKSAPVAAEFRVFAGAEEVTAHTRLRIMPTGTRDQATTVAGGKHLVTSVPPGIYDVQALRMRHEGIVAIKWAERLVVMHYPDEAGRHLEVINFQPGYGALQLRVPGGSPITGYELAVFPVGDHTTPAGEPIEGDGYRLFVLKAGRYDIRVRPAGRTDDLQATRWIRDVEVPADRTRLKQVG